ncbi:MAG: peptidylprolyl isomerase [Candidatus Thermoplasmatota archaeon]|nr:peptidylprolyl isomerase [Candidatus Thermoplasmatota archaeon]
MNNGDFIKIDYEMTVGDDKKVVSTNSKKIAEDNGIYDEHFKYGDFVAIVGSEAFFKTINDSFLTAKKGEEYTVETRPEDGFGTRDPKNIRVHTIREFQRLNIEPEVGKEVLLNQRRGRIISVTPGRVMVDYNHRYAGKVVHYKYKILDIITDDVEKVKSVISMSYPIEIEKFTIEHSGEEVTVRIPDESKFDPAWFEAKFSIVNEVRKNIPNVVLVFKEVYEKEEKPKEEEPKEETKSEDKEEAPEEKDEKKDESSPEKTES